MTNSAKQSTSDAAKGSMDCFVASLLAKTKQGQIIMNI